MTTALPAGPATTSTEGVAGLRLVTVREREVEHALLDLAAGLGRHGVRVTWLTTHRTVTDDGVACAGAVTAAVAPDLLAGYLHVVTRELADTVEVVDLDGPDASAAADARRSRSEGRAVVFPGVDDVGDTVTVGDLLERTAIQAVEVVGGRTAAPDTVLATRRYLRPRFTGGRLVLPAQPAAGGVLVPFEFPNPTPCCADHA